MNFSLFIGLVLYYKHSNSQRLGFYLALFGTVWTMLIEFVVYTIKNSHFLDRFYPFLHLLLGINLVFVIAKSESLKKYASYVIYIYVFSWLIYVSIDELYKVAPILNGITYTIGSTFMLFLMYDVIKNNSGKLFKEPNIYIVLGSYIFFAGSAIVLVLLQHFMNYWDAYPNARFFKPALHITVNFFYYCLLIYSFICNRSTDN